MEPRGRDLLRAEAKFLSDYCDEDALLRWQERLSDREREQLVPALRPLQEACRRIIEVVWRLIQAMVEPVTTLLRSLSEMLAAACAVIAGRTIEPFGREAA